MHRFGNGRDSERALRRKQDFALVANIDVYSYRGCIIRYLNNLLYLILQTVFIFFTLKSTVTFYFVLLKDKKPKNLFWHIMI